MKKIIPYVFIVLYYLIYPFHSANAAVKMKVSEDEFIALIIISAFAFPGIFLLMKLVNDKFEDTNGRRFFNNIMMLLLYLLLIPFLFAVISFFGAILSLFGIH